MLLIGIVAGAFIGGFMSSETITYYNYTQVVASFQPYSGFDDANSSSSYVIVPAVDENGKGVATMMEVQIVPGERRALVDIGHPAMERHRRNFEPEPDQHQGRPRYQVDPGCLMMQQITEIGYNATQIGCFSRAKYESDAQQQKSRSKRAHHEILDAGFI